MPTFNQLVRKNRKKVVYKSNAPALQMTMNTLKKKPVLLGSPKRGVCTVVRPSRRKSRTLLFARLQGSV